MHCWLHPVSPLSALKPGLSPSALPVKEEQDHPGLELDEPGAWLRCAICKTPVTRRAWRLAVAGKDAHVFFNPDGWIFELVCFSAAPGCRCSGKGVLEFTWFPGYAWRPAHCRGCRAHLGWDYRNASGHRFFGLIVETLIEDPEDLPH
jgi:hypothetical protein